MKDQDTLGVTVSSEPCFMIIEKEINGKLLIYALNAVSQAIGDTGQEWSIKLWDIGWQRRRRRRREQSGINKEMIQTQYVAHI